MCSIADVLFFLLMLPPVALVLGPVVYVVKMIAEDVWRALW